MLAIRSGIPLALQARKRRRGTKDYSTPAGSSSTSSSASAGVGGPTSRKRNSTGGSKKGDLGVRKDLTLPTAPTAEEDNVFQSEDSSSGIIPGGAGQADSIFADSDCGLTLHGGNSSGNNNPGSEIITDGGGEGIIGAGEQNLGLDDDDITEQEEDVIPHKGKSVNCIECTMSFSTPGQLRQHVK